MNTNTIYIYTRRQSNKYHTNVYKCYRKCKHWVISESMQNKLNTIWQLSYHITRTVPSCVLGLLQQQCLIFRAQSLLPGIEVILEASHCHLAPSRSGSVHDKATLACQTAQHPGAQRQQHHWKEAHWTGHFTHLLGAAKMGRVTPGTVEC